MTVKQSDAVGQVVVGDLDLRLVVIISFRIFTVCQNTNLTRAKAYEIDEALAESQLVYSYY